MKMLVNIIFHFRTHFRELRPFKTIQLYTYISILDCLGKLMERFIHKYLYKYVFPIQSLYHANLVLSTKILLSTSWRFCIATLMKLEMVLRSLYSVTHPRPLIGFDTRVSFIWVLLSAFVVPNLADSLDIMQTETKELSWRTPIFPP